MKEDDSWVMYNHYDRASKGFKDSKNDFEVKHPYDIELTKSHEVTPSLHYSNRNDSWGPSSGSPLKFNSSQSPPAPINSRVRTSEAGTDFDPFYSTRSKGVQTEQLDCLRPKVTMELQPSSRQNMKESPKKACEKMISIWSIMKESPRKSCERMISIWSI
jgi:hypothetical protein